MIISKINNSVSFGAGQVSLYSNLNTKQSPSSSIAGTSPLNSLAVAQKVVTAAEKKDDLIVFASDNAKDFEKLNPLSYIEEEFEKECAKKARYKEFYSSSMAERLDLLQKVLDGDKSKKIVGLRKELKAFGYMKKLTALPMSAVIVRGENPNMRKLASVFASMGKVVAVEAEQIDKGIKAVVKNYAVRNSKFHNAMPSNIKELVFDMKTKVHSKKPSLKKVAAFAGVAVFGTFCYKMYHRYD